MTPSPSPAAGRACATGNPRWTASTWCAALAIAATGGWLRLDQLLQQPLIDDEWHAVHQLLLGTPSTFLLSWGRDDHSIALTALYWLQMQTVGLSELGMRLPLLLAGLLSLAALPWALGGSLDRRVKLLMALLLAVSTLLVGYSRMARPYALTLLLTLTALALLHQALQPPRVRWGLAAAYAGLAGLSAWLHAVTAPFVLAPLLALALQTARGQGLPWRTWCLLAGLTAGPMALALLPPLLADAGALAAKAGRDLPRWSTLQGVSHVWLGTSSTGLVVVCLGLAGWGAADVWRSSQVARWTLLGLALTALAIVIMRPVWVFNPLTFGRYLLPALPLLLLAVAAGVVRLADDLVRLLRLRPMARRALPAAMGVLLAGSTWARSPQPDLIRAPNSYTLSYYWQFDFRPRRNPVVSVFDAIELPAFWASLAGLPRDSQAVAVLPYRFESPAWLGPLWERASHQRVVPAFLSGACAHGVMGDVPPDRRFALRNGVHLSAGPQALARHVDHVALDRKGTVTLFNGQRRGVPECEAWLRQQLGAPQYQDAQLLVWSLRGARP